MDLYEFIEDYISEHGHSRETFECIIRDFQDALLDHAIKIDGSIVYDDNEYE